MRAKSASALFVLINHELENLRPRTLLTLTGEFQRENAERCSGPTDEVGGEDDFGAQQHRTDQGRVDPLSPYR